MLEATRERTVYLLQAMVGEYTLYIDPESVLAVEAQREVIEDGILVGVDLREWLQTPPLPGHTSEALLVASDEAAYHTGDSIRVDGGYSVF